MPNRAANSQHRTFRPTPLLLALGYGALVAYGTLYPFSGWSPPEYNLIERMFERGLSGSKTDILVNFVVYIPFGLLLFNALSARLSPAAGLLAVTAAGAALSLCLEYLQAFMPARVPSLLDLILNTVSTLAGGLLGLLWRRDTRIGARMNAWRQELFKPGPTGNLGLLLLGLWSLSQLTPLVPSLDVGHLLTGIKPVWLAIQGQQPFMPVKALVYTCQIAAVALLLERTLRTHQMPSKVPTIAFALGMVLVLKIPVMSRAISLEAIAGLVCGLLILALMGWTRRRDRSYAAIFFLVTAHTVDTLRAPLFPSFQTQPFNWVPFQGHLANELIGFGSILDALWPFLALSLAVQLSYREKPPANAAYAGALLVFVFAFTLEWLQQAVPGRYPDLTTACIAVAGWSAPWAFSALNVTRSLQNGAAANPAFPTRPLTVTGAMAGLVWVIGLASLALRPATLIETRVDQSRMPTHAAPEDLPAVQLPGFRYSHPRLPAPSSADIQRLQRENPGYLKGIKRSARKGSGKLSSAVVSAFIEPGSVDLNTLHERLMALKPSWRGHQQAKPLATAYDWLYPQWTDRQREQLREKLVESGRYLIKRIRSTRLSPYNVYLYNSPLQALMAVSLAVYGDTPEAEPIMRFSADFWKRRTLPVWRQVMGNNGGWHEGGEYVGIGIGQAIYQLPAMWRSATGEDLFSEPGIKGFLDFLVYRIRPDGTHMRWGDGGYHDRDSPDRAALAIEFRHPAAYSLPTCPKRMEPTSWPWGPLPDDSLCDPNAAERLPLTRYFDGIGLLVARSGWDDTATYLTFKAGDNFWSHSHLDQGAFTLFKGGALAIDSGHYAGYGSDHHMNYSYQSIAHNLVTVTDPRDRVPKPEKKGPPRPIANDGGQRRVGSGWGVEAAPIDLAEWQRKQQLYHTGSMLKLATEPNLVLAVADLAPAYTNSLSGAGTFSHRTHRVAAYVRTLGFDPQNEVVVIHDRVKATSMDFPKRWLLHTIQRPDIQGSSFATQVQPANKPKRRGGRLQGRVLLPKAPYMDLMGGPGFEFFVGGTNYDNDGEVWESVKKRPALEPGSWRIELSPSSPRREERFLVVLAPTATGERHKQLDVRLLEQGDRYGCQITTPLRTTRWWFDDRHDGPLVELVDEQGSHTRDFRVVKRPDVEVKSQRLSRLARILGIDTRGP